MTKKFGKNKSKGFASTIFAGLALLIIALSAAAVLSMQESEVNAKKLFQAKQTSWLYSDAEKVLENALYDAETDSAYAGYGCQTDVDVCTALKTTRNASAYMQNALANLTASTRNAALEIKGVTVTCTELETCAGGASGLPQEPQQPAPPGEPQAAEFAYGCQNFSITAEFALKTSSSNSIKIQRVTFENQLSVFRITYPNGNPTRFGIAVSKDGQKILDLRGTCSIQFLSAPQATPTPAASKIFTTPSPVPRGSPQAGVPTATQPAAIEATPIPSLFASATPPTAPAAPTTPAAPRPTQAAGSQPLMILALIIAVLLLAAFYFNKKQRPEPKSFSYVARQKKRL